MVSEVILNDTVIEVEQYLEEIVDSLHKIIIDFKVTSEKYHDIAVLLYEGSFNIKVPQIDLAFRGKIIEYSTSVINLYEKEQVGDYHLVLLEEK